MKYFITGAAGFVGHRLISKLLKNRDNYVVASDRVNLELVGDRLTFIKSDVDKLNRGSIDAEILIHLVGSPGVWFSEKHPQEDHKIACESIMQALNAMKECKHVILASSWQVYGENKKIETSECAPVNAYGRNKLEAEKELMRICEKRHSHWTILRMSWIYGPNMKKNPIFDIYNGCVYMNMSSRLDFVHVDDVCEGMISASKDNRWRDKIVNISSGKNISLDEVCRLFERLGFKKGISILDDDKIDVVVDSSLAKSIGWQTKVDFKDGLKETYESFGRRL